MSYWFVESEDNYGETVCSSCRHLLKSCVCIEPYECAVEIESNTDLSSTGDLFDSNSSWQHIESDHDQQQQKQGLHSRIPEAQTDHGLTSQRLDDLQFDLSHNSHNDNVDHWERPYNPIHSQILVDSTNAMQPSDGNESSSSTMLPLSDYGRVDVVWDDPHGRYQQSQPVSNAPRPACSQRDFVEGNFARVIWLVGAPAAVKSLQQTVGEHMKKQWTSGQHQLCALYALEISLLAMYPNDPAAHANISFNSLLGIFQGVEYQQEAFRQAEVVRNAQVREELLSQTNLSVNAVLIILRILNRRMNENFALGVCTPSARGITDSALPEYSYDVHLQPTSSDSFYTRAVWIYNNKLDLDGSGSLKNHWSGFGYSTLTQNNTPMPHFCLNVKCVDAVSPNVEIDRSAACTPPSTAGSSYHLAGSPQFSNHSSSAYTSRMSSIEPDYGSYSGDKLSTRKPFIKHKSPSQSSRNSNKEQVQCEFCGKVIQKSGLSKHKKTHDQKHAQQGRKHPCPQCLKRFPYPKDVRRHQSTHNPSREWKCQFLDCPYATDGFTRDDHLFRHMATVHSYPVTPDAAPSDNYVDDAPLFG